MFHLKDFAFAQSLMNNRRIVEEFDVLQMRVIIQDEFAVVMGSLRHLTISCLE